MTQMPPVVSSAIFEPSGDHVGLPENPIPQSADALPGVTSRAAGVTSRTPHAAS
jgi:hypothetical protein